MSEKTFGGALDCVVTVDYKPLGNQGEDAYCYDFTDAGLHAQAVFDGCGGAGAWRYPEYYDRTGAFVAAQTMARSFPEWLAALKGELPEPPALAESFRAAAKDALTELKQNAAPMGVSGTLVKAFPTTASVALMRPAAEGLELTVLNSGDSRVYFLTPDRGLVQLTKDDSRGHPDPMESLKESAPLSDMLNADKPFEVKAMRLTLPMPCAVLCASDGMFGFLRSPMDFEHLLLDELMRADSLSAFEKAVKAKIVAVTGDDSTCVMSFYGWGSLDAMKRSLAGRHRIVADLIAQMDAAAPDERDEVIHRLWADYKQNAIYDEAQV